MHLDHRRHRPLGSTLRAASELRCRREGADRELLGARRRGGWRHARLLSSSGNTYNSDYRAETADGDQLPIANVFVRGGGKVHHFWSSEVFNVPNAIGLHPRHVDFMWPVWAVLDRTPEGHGTNGNPALDYPR